MHAVNCRRRHSTLPRAARGMTLIEVLIAIVIFAIGLLGIASLQVSGLRYTKASQARATAAIQAENLIDRMRANPIGVNNGLYFNLEQVADPSGLPPCAGADCTPEQIATYDWGWWLSETRQALGVKRDDGAFNSDSSVRATVCIDSTPDDGTVGAWACDDIGNMLAVKIEWLERTVERSGKVADDYSASGTASGLDGYVVNRFVVRFLP
jgi:type IV pilus assembly protein PilV